MAKIFREMLYWLTYMTAYETDFGNTVFLESPSGPNRYGIFEADATREQKNSYMQYFRQ